VNKNITEVAVVAKVVSRAESPLLVAALSPSQPLRSNTFWLGSGKSRKKLTASSKLSLHWRRLLMDRPVS
jgi:hypothetical protein